MKNRIAAICKLALLALWLAFCASLPLSAAQSTAALLCLSNANFEDGFTVREAQEVEVAVGWDYSYMSGDDRWCPAPCYRPEHKPETEIVVEGTSQRWFTTFARQFGTIHQQVDVEEGEWYKFSCQVYAVSEPDGQLAVMVGANPWGAGPFDRTMLWGQQQPWGQYRQWHEASVTFQAFGDRVRVAVGANNNYPTKNNAIYVDNCRLERAGFGPSPTPQPCPTCVPGGGCSCADVRAIIRQELGNTSLRVQ